MSIAMRTASGREVGIDRWMIEGTASAGATVGAQPGGSAARSRWRRAAAREANARRLAAVASRAAARASDPATSGVPERSPRSWPPPGRSVSAGIPRRATRHPTPTGAPVLCPATLMRSTPSSSKRTSTTGTAWAASVWVRAPPALIARARAATGWTAPVSEHTRHIEATATDGARAARAASSMGVVPVGATGSSSHAKPSLSATARWLATASCSTEETRIRVRAVSEARAPLAAAITPRASDSVAPDVKSTSWMSAPSWWATLSRASSSIRRARRPPEWRAAGLPGEAPSSRWAATHASSAAGSRGEVAAWSR